MGFSNSKHWLLLWRAWLPAPTGTPDANQIERCQPLSGPSEGSVSQVQTWSSEPSHHHFQLSLENQQNKGCIGSSPFSRLVWFTGPEPFKEGKNS